MKQLTLGLSDAPERALRSELPVRDEAHGLLSPDERAFFGARDREKIGRWAENVSAEFLSSQGVDILERNVRERFSEIDIVACDRGEMIFVEVRCRRDNPVMSALDTLGPHKWKRLARGAELYVQRRGWDGGWRVDLIAVDVRIPAWRLKWYRYLEMEEAEDYGG